MTDDKTSTRRQVLIGLGTAGAVSLAGCSAGSGGGAGGTPTDAEMNGGMETVGGGTETMGGPTPTPVATPTPSTANVRVVHASPNAPAVDVYVDDNAVLEGVGFGAVSDYLELPAGTYTVGITAAGDPEAVVFRGDVTVAADTDYTIVAAGEIGDMAGEAFAPLILTDDNSAPDDDTARIRLVHTSPDAPAVDVTLASTGDALFDGVPFGGSGYIEVPAGDYTIDVRGDTGGNDGDVVASFDLSLAGGAVYTGFAVGYLSPGDEPADTAFDLVVARDAAAN